MPYKTFADDKGRSWEIREVHPTSVERRAADRREEQAIPWTVLDRRTDDNRRIRLDGRLDPSHQLAHGWLVFKSDGEKRRLAHIPPTWESCNEQELRALLERANVTVSGMEKPA